MLDKKQAFTITRKIEFSLLVEGGFKSSQSISNFLKEILNFKQVQTLL